MENQPNLVKIIDPDGKVKYVSADGVKFWGIDKDGTPQWKPLLQWERDANRRAS
jgi:hypothetical protein